MRTLRHVSVGEVFNKIFRLTKVFKLHLFLTFQYIYQRSMKKNFKSRTRTTIRYISYVNTESVF